MLCQSVAGGDFIQSNGSIPPQFEGVGERFADFLPSSVHVEISLNLYVIVRDEDGIDTVMVATKKITTQFGQMLRCPFQLN